MRANLKPATVPALLAICSAAAFALGLGEPALESTIGQPLRARIPLLLQPGETATPGCVTVAPSPGDAAEYALRGARAELVNGGRDILVTTPGPVNAPVASFSLRAECAGQLAARDYTVLPDPAAAVAPSAAPPPRRPAASAPRAGVGPGTLWDLRPGESVRAIAAAIYPGAPGLQRRLVSAIVNANPGAFAEGDPDRPAPGAVILIPDLRTLGATVEDARAGAPRRARAARDEIAVPERLGLPLAEFTGLLQRIGGLEVLLAGMQRAVLALPSPSAAPKPPPLARPPQPAESGGAAVWLAAAAALLALGGAGFYAYRKRRSAAEAPASAGVNSATGPAPEPPPASGVEAALQEAQLSVARGYPQRAFELLEQHIRAQPEETRTWMLLFAILRSQHMSTEYLDLALRFAATRPPRALWQEVQRMGRELDPDGLLFRDEPVPSMPQDSGPARA